jgi:hypothetical protein
MQINKVFKKIYIVPDWANGHIIQWELDPFFCGKEPYNFSLQVAQTIDFSEIIFTKENLGDTFFVVDDLHKKQSSGYNYAYRVVLETADNKRYVSHPVWFIDVRGEQRKYAMASEIVRKEILACRYAGTDGWLLKRKTYSTVSPVTQKNLDPVSGVPLTDTKGEDYGVGLDAGYFAPVPVVFFIETSSQDKQLDPSGIGVKETFDSMIRLPGYPIIEVRDIICDARDGTRSSIMTKGFKYFPGTNIPILQKAGIRLIPPSDTVYSIPLPLYKSYVKS